MSERAKESQCIVSFFSVKNHDVQPILDDLIANRVRGVINLAGFTCDFSCYDIFIGEGIPLINCTAEGPKVNVDYTSGMEQAMGLLRDSGCRNVAFLAGLEEWLALKDQRVIYYCRNLKKYGFSENPNLLLFGNYPQERSYTEGYRMCMELIASGEAFDAIFCLNDMTALGVMKALFDKNLKIPQDVSVIGCDDLDFTGYFQPALTTVSGDKKAEGYAYIDFILGHLPPQERSIRIPTYLVVRDSVAAKRSK